MRCLRFGERRDCAPRSGLRGGGESIADKAAPWAPSSSGRSLIHRPELPAIAAPHRAHPPPPMLSAIALLYPPSVGRSGEKAVVCPITVVSKLFVCLFVCKASCKIADSSLLPSEFQLPALFAGGTKRCSAPRLSATKADFCRKPPIRKYRSRNRGLGNEKTQRGLHCPAVWGCTEPSSDVRAPSAHREHRTRRGWGTNVPAITNKSACAVGRGWTERRIVKAGKGLSDPQPHRAHKRVPQRRTSTVQHLQGRYLQPLPGSGTTQGVLN